MCGTMQSSTLAIEPECYPLSQPMIVRFAYDRNIPLTVSTETNTFSSAHATPVLRESEMLRARAAGNLHTTQNGREELVCEIKELRERTSSILEPVLSHPTLLTTDWFRQALREHTPPLEKRGKAQKESQEVELFSEKTLSMWRTRGLLRSDERDKLNFHTAFAVMMMRLADHRRERGFLPPGQYDQEAYMYVWRQDTPQSPVIPCGLPLADDVPNHAFLFTPWKALGEWGTSRWLPFSHMGSVRWKGVREDMGTILWDMSEQDIALWDPSIAPLGNGIIDDVLPLTRHTLATMILLKQASEAFQRNTVT